MNKELTPLEALERLTKIHTHDEFRECYEIIETALKDYEMQKRIVKDLQECKGRLIEERNKRIIERRAIYEDYNFQFLKKDVACKGCQYYKDEKCTNKDDCFWLELERKLKALEIIKEKKVNIEFWFSFKDSIRTYKEYTTLNKKLVITSISKKQLTKEEFDLLKEVLK